MTPTDWPDTLPATTVRRRFTELLKELGSSHVHLDAFLLQSLQGVQHLQRFACISGNDQHFGHWFPPCVGHAPTTQHEHTEPVQGQQDAPAQSPRCNRLQALPFPCATRYVD